MYDPAGAYAFADHAEAARYAGLMADAEAARRDGWLGRSTVRSFRAGRWLSVRAGVTVDDLSVGQEVELVVDTLFVDDEAEHQIYKWTPVAGGEA